MTALPICLLRWRRTKKFIVCILDNYHLNLIICDNELSLGSFNFLYGCDLTLDIIDIAVSIMLLRLLFRSCY
jgi:hypothetical protein